MHGKKWCSICIWEVINPRIIAAVHGSLLFICIEEKTGGANAIDSPTQEMLKVFFTGTRKFACVQIPREMLRSR